nr:hypothetical protein [Tanacetum cinerariifolium]
NKDNDDNEIDMIQSSRGNENTQESNKLLEASHDKINKVFIMKCFVMVLNVNIMAWNYLVNGILFNLIKNLNVPFGIPFDPKQYYKDDMAPLPPREQRHPFLRYQGLKYSDKDIAYFKERIRMEHRVGDGVLVFTGQAWGGARRHMRWREFILALGLHTGEEMESLGFARDPVLRLCHRMMTHSIAGRSQAPEKGERITRLEEEVHGMREVLQG